VTDGEGALGYARVMLGPEMPPRRAEGASDPIDGAPGGGDRGAADPFASPRGAWPTDVSGASAGSYGEVPAADDGLAGARLDVGRGVAWLYWTVGLTVANAVIAGFGAQLSFALALSSSLLPAFLGHAVSLESETPALAAIGVALAMVPPALLLGLTLLGKSGRAWALLGAVLLVTADAGLAALFEDWLGVLLHAVCIYFAFRAWLGARAIGRVTATGPGGGPPPTASPFS
jgi:hypothetical protein